MPSTTAEDSGGGASRGVASCVVFEAESSGRSGPHVCSCL